MIQLNAAANQRVKVTAAKVTFNGVNSANTPALVQWVYQTGGTFTNGSVAGVKTNEPNGQAETPNTLSKNTATVEPTVTYTPDQFFEPVFGGFVWGQLTPGQELIIPGGINLGLKINAPQSVSCTVSIDIEE